MRKSLGMFENSLMSNVFEKQSGRSQCHLKRGKKPTSAAVSLNTQFSLSRLALGNYCCFTLSTFPREDLKHETLLCLVDLSMSKLYLYFQLHLKVMVEHLSLYLVLISTIWGRLIIIEVQHSDKSSLKILGVTL